MRRPEEDDWVNLTTFEYLMWKKISLLNIDCEKDSKRFNVGQFTVSTITERTFDFNLSVGCCMGNCENH